MEQTKKINTQKIATNLWFDDQAEEAVNFYTSIFNNAEIGKVSRYGKEGFEIHGRPAGSVMTMEFELEGQTFTALNGGPHFQINPSISFFINCDTEAEVERFWEKLSDDGKALMPLEKYDFSEKYGWIQDKFGVSWQVILSSPEGDWRPKIIPSLLFTGKNSGKTKEAIDFYTAVFDDAKVGMIAPNEKPGTEGTTAFADFMLENKWFAAMDSPIDHDFGFNEAISFVVNCKNQEEVDGYWQKLSAVPQAEQCGWLKDKFGVSWQIIPIALIEMTNDANTERSGRVMEAMLQMKKIDINGLKQAYEGKTIIQ